MSRKERLEGVYEENPPVTEELLQEMARRICEAGDPIQIILFGSHARGEAGPYSDVDLLVVDDSGRSRMEAALAYREMLFGNYPATDLIVRTPEEMESRKGRTGRIEYYVHRDGRVLYEREEKDVVK